MPVFGASREVSVNGSRHAVGVMEQGGRSGCIGIQDETSIPGVVGDGPCCCKGWSKLAKNLKAEIDETLIEAYRGTVSLPFAPGAHGRVAVKIVDDRGIESLKIMEVQ